MTDSDMADPLPDPRPDPSDEAVAVDSGGALRPAVAGRSGNGGVWLAAGGAVLLGLLVFLWLAGHRPGPPKDIRALNAPESTATTTALPVPPPDVDAMEAASRNPPPPPAQPALPPPPPVQAIITPPPVVTPPAPVIIDNGQRRKAPALVVDFGEGATAAAAKAATAGAAGAHAPALNGDEQFAERVESSQPERSKAFMLRNKSTVVPQGAVIPAVLETALNSDLPGYTRAVVSRDVRSFDGSTVLIPRGSRVIGQYHSAAALGASRAFVIWTRILRPDGASIQIGSSGGDELGRAGLAGKVDRHFFERFGGGILLSVINAGVTALAGTPSTQVVIGSSQDASSIAGSASPFLPSQISPTIKVAQGTPIRIFVARDLDFTPVEGPEQ